MKVELRRRRDNLIQLPMLHRYLSVCAVLLILQGCTHIRHDPAPFEVINKRGQASTAVVTLSSGISFDAEALRVTSDSTYWITPVGKKLESVSTLDIASVEFRSRPRGAVDGMLTGLGLGFLGGFGFGAVAGVDYAKQNQALAAVVIGTWIGAIGAAWGAAFGLPAGAVVGAKLEYPIAPVIQEGSQRPKPGIE